MLLLHCLLTLCVRINSNTSWEKKKLLIKIMWLKSSRTACSKATVVKSELCVSDVFTIIIPILIIMSHRHSLSNTINVILSSNVNWLQRNEPQKALISATWAAPSNPLRYSLAVCYPATGYPYSSGRWQHKTLSPNTQPNLFSETSARAHYQSFTQGHTFHAFLKGGYQTHTPLLS